MSRVGAYGHRPCAWLADDGQPTAPPDEWHVVGTGQLACVLHLPVLEGRVQDVKILSGGLGAQEAPPP